MFAPYRAVEMFLSMLTPYRNNQQSMCVAGSKLCVMQAVGRWGYGFGLTEDILRSSYWSKLGLV